MNPNVLKSVMLFTFLVPIFSCANNSNSHQHNYVFKEAPTSNCAYDETRANVETNEGARELAHSQCKLSCP